MLPTIPMPGNPLIIIGFLLSSWSAMTCTNGSSALSTITGNYALSKYKTFSRQKIADVHLYTNSRFIESLFSHKKQHRIGDSINEYKFKRGFKPEIGRIKNVIVETFHVEPREDGDKLIVQYGAMKELRAWIQDKKFFVETQSDLGVKDESIILDTNKKFRDFLEESTGYTAKERLKMAKKEVSSESG
ncbi:MAG TPA: DUF5611 family protein [Methanocella sp.]|nr:DUF5611 family protein [Methanocella sp.]